MSYLIDEARLSGVTSYHLDNLRKLEDACKKHLFSPEAKEYMQYGFSRRLLMITEDYSYIVTHCNSMGSKPLDIKVAAQASAALNSIYLHLVGAFDNLAWIVSHETNFPRKHKNDVGFGFKKKKFDAHLKIKILNSKYEIFSNENESYFHNRLKDISGKRDPCAHRIPLYIPYKNSNGMFEPVFVETPSSSPKRIYVELERDIGLLNILFDFIHKSLILAEKEEEKYKC